MLDNTVLLVLLKESVPSNFYILDVIFNPNLLVIDRETDSFLLLLQKPRGFRERAGRGARCPGGLPGFCAAGPRLLHWHLGLPVLPRHCKLPVFFTEGEYFELIAQLC